MFVTGIQVQKRRKQPLLFLLLIILDNESASKESGIHIKRVSILVYARAGGLAAMVASLLLPGLILPSPMPVSAMNWMPLQPWELGALPFPEAGKYLGTVQGAIVTNVLNNDLVMLNVSPFW